MPWALMTCGQCGHEADLSTFCTTPISGELPKGVYQCPACGLAIRKTFGPATRHPSGWVEPGKVKLELVAGRL